MKYTVTGKNISITKAMDESIQKKLSVLDKYILIDDNTTARVVARTYKHSQKVEVTIPTRVGVLRTEVVKDDFYEALDLAIDKLEGQIRKQKTRLNKHHKEHLSKAFIEKEQKEVEQDVDVKTKHIDTDEMTLDEALLQMELSGHNFYIYKDEDTGKYAIAYNRHDGYGCIEVD